MLTQAAERTLAVPAPREVLSRQALHALGVTASQVKARIAAHRWQLCGRAIVLHNGALTRRQSWQVALVNGGPRAALTAFTAAEVHGLRGWEREEIHLIAPAGTPSIRVPGLTVVVHRSASWDVPAQPTVSRCQALAPSLVIAAGSFDSPRPACAILAAGVQQRAVTANRLRLELRRNVRVRHRRLLVAAVADIEGGSESLSEIDFVRLCRRARLPLPQRQQVRSDSAGRRRYLDATWRRCDGRLVVVEVDAALHLSPRRWWDDQLRQNEIVLDDALVLRYPSITVRTEPAVIVAQLRRALLS